MISLTNREKYALDLIDKNKSLINSLQDLFFSKFRLNRHNNKLKSSCINKINGLNVVVIDKEFFGNNYSLKSELEVLSKEDRKIIILHAIEGFCNELIYDVEDRL